MLRATACARALRCPCGALSVSWVTVELDACSSLLLQSIGNIYIYAPIYNINIYGK